jgi:hypothetical protein
MGDETAPSLTVWRAAKGRRPKPTPGTIDPHRRLSSLQRSNKERHTGDLTRGRGSFPQTINGRTLSRLSFARGEEDEGYLSFEVYWQHEGWFWRPLLRLDGEAVGPFTTTTQAYENAMATKCHPAETAQSS